MSVKLGSVAKDKISGFTGVVVARTEWLNGCVRITIAPQSLHDGRPIESCTFDESDVETVSEMRAGKQVPVEEAKATATGGDRPAIGRASDPR